MADPAKQLSVEHLEFLTKRRSAAASRWRQGSTPPSSASAPKEGAGGADLNVADSCREVDHRVALRCGQTGGAHQCFGELLDDAGGQRPWLMFDGGLEQDPPTTGVGGQSAGGPDVPGGGLDWLAGPAAQGVGRVPAASGARVKHGVAVLRHAEVAEMVGGADGKAGREHRGAAYLEGQEPYPVPPIGSADVGAQVRLGKRRDAG